VLLGVDGRSDFDALHSRRHDAEVEFYAFDILVSGGEDLRGLPLSMRKASLSRLLARRVDGIFLSDFEQGEIGPDLFRHACLMGLEGMVSKHRESLYRGGRFRHWVKVKIDSIQRLPACRISSVEAALALGFENPAPSICPQSVHSLSTARRIAFVDNLPLRMRRRRKSASSPRSYSQEGWVTARAH
jgi:hypothetical protein